MDRLAFAPVVEVLDRRRFLAWTMLAFLIGLGLRLLFLATADIDVRIRGDILGYWIYAQNLLEHGVFSSATGDAPRNPDGFRGPGYPAFLAACMALAGAPERAVAVATLVQVFVGALLVPATIAVGRDWLGRGAALACGFIVAFWPHLVVQASTLLSETLLAFLLLAFLWLACRVAKGGLWRWSVAAGASAAAAWLVNPLVFFFPLAVAALLASRGLRRPAVVMLLAFALPVAGWTLRNATLPAGSGSSDRALLNLVEGSWPLYHDAHIDRNRNSIARAMADAIAAEEALIRRDPAAGLAAMRARIAEDPGYYARWYALGKPFLLWDWGIRMGAGDVYVLETRNSPYERNAALRTVHTLFRTLNPAFFAAAAAAGLGCLVVVLRGRRAPFAFVVACGLFLYVTAIHVVLQAEPRYAVAYRPVEVLLAVSVIAWATSRLRARQPG